MGDKFDGALAVGHPAIAHMQDDMDIAEALQSLTLHETLVTKDEDGHTVLLRAEQNPAAGGIMMVREEIQDHSHVMKETIRRSQMTSMLADEARCSKYNDAIKRVLENRPGATVIDIGTGTGLLAMLSAKAGASHVTAIEMFAPLADLAEKIVRENDLHEKISVVCASSTDISVDTTCEEETIVLGKRADVLVTEIFDSALLGENCVPAINHAHANLLKEGASVIPARARLYATVINSDFFYKFRNFPHSFPLHDNDARHCRGGSTGIPVHLDGLTAGMDYEILTDPFEVFQFDFTKPSVPKYRQKSNQVARTKKGRPDAILTWWELDLTESGDIMYSTKSGVENWQDHWLQVVYPLSGSKNISSMDSTIPLTMEHDESSFSFAHGLNEEPSVICQCGFHSIMTPYRIHEVGDPASLEQLSSRLRTVLEKSQESNSTGSDKRGAIRCIDVSDNSVCAVLAGRTKCERNVEIFSVEEDNEISSFLFSRIADHSKAADNDVFVEYDPLSAFIRREMDKKESSETWESFDVIMSEPFTRAMHAFPIATLGNLMVQRMALSELLKNNFTMVPSVGRIQAQLVYFPRNTVQRSFICIDNVQGLDVRPYSRMLLDEEWDQRQRRLSLPLFQYNVTPCSEKTCLVTIDFCAEDHELLSNHSETWIALTYPSEIDAVALNVEYDGIPANRIARSELIWLSEVEKRYLSNAGGLAITCDFSQDTGTWDILVEPRRSKK